MAQIDWYTDFYYPFLKRWTERVRRVVANGRGHEKLFFTEPIPNEVKQGSFALAFHSLLTHAPVLSTIMDTGTPASKHGVRASLVIAFLSPSVFFPVLTRANQVRSSCALR